MSAKKPQQTAPVEVALKRLDIRTLGIRLVSDSPLVVHAWSQKARQQMLDKQMKKASAGKAAKDPVADFRASLYRMPDGAGFGFPAVGFKSAAVDAANLVEMKKTESRGAFHIEGELIRVIAPPVESPLTECDEEFWEQIAEERKFGASMRSDMVRVGMGTSDIRFRAQFVSWSVEINVRFNASVITPEQIVNLFNVAGFAVGVGEHRPQRDGSNGMFHVV